MLRSCKHCGRIHDEKFDCGKKPKKDYSKYEKDPEIASFRRTQAWKDMSWNIRERDNHLCQLCIRNLYMIPCASSLTYENISVHHIEPLSEAPAKALDRENLISLCSYHHELAEKGKISREELRSIVRDQERAESPCG